MENYSRHTEVNQLKEKSFIVDQIELWKSIRIDWFRQIFFIFDTQYPASIIK